MSILKHLDKNNLHHAYLIEGLCGTAVLEIQEFLKSLDIKVIGNPDFIHIQLDSLKIEDARNLKSYATQKSFSGAKRIFIVSTNNFLLEAQNSLLKMFEEPIEDTLFFIIIPDINVLLKTFVSRFYLIKEKNLIEVGDAEKFILMPFKDRIDFIKELLTKEDGEDEEGNEVVVLDSVRSKALKFLNTLEFVLHGKIIKKISRTALGIDVSVFQHFFKVREFLRMPGSSTKILMESVALIIPNMLQ